MSFKFGDPNLFVQGMVDVTFFNPSTGDVVGYDRVGNDVATNYTFDMTELTGGFQNQLVGLIPHSTRLSGTYTSAAFSLEQRALISGGETGYNGIAYVCETVTASGTSLAVTGTPVKSYAQSVSDKNAWCYVRDASASTYVGTNYGIDIDTKTVQNFTAVSGKTYQVFYFTRNASALAMNLPVAANPNVVSVQQKWGVYSAQNQNNGNSIFKGYLYFYVPLAILEGDAGIDGNQTTNSTTPYNWRAISPSENMPDCDDCGTSASSLAYYVFVPCGDSAQAAEAMVVAGGAVTVKKGESVNIPVFFVMPDQSVVVPDYSKLSLSGAETGLSLAGNVLSATSGATTGADPATLVYAGTDVSLSTEFVINVTA